MGSETWELTSGLLDDFTLQVDEAWFGEDEENDDERIYLFLRGLAVDEDGDEDDEYRERFRVGQNWEAVDKGGAVENATGKHKFNKNSGVGRLIKSIVAIDEKTTKAMIARGDANQAETYLGLNIHFIREEQTPFENDDGDKVEWNILNAVEVKFPKAKKKANKKADKKGSDSKKASEGKKDKAPSLKKQAIAFAGQFEDDEHTTFVEQILDAKTFPAAADIEDDDELHADILDDGGNVWKKARKVWAENN